MQHEPGQAFLLSQLIAGGKNGAFLGCGSDEAETRDDDLVADHRCVAVYRNNRIEFVQPPRDRAGSSFNREIDSIMVARTKDHAGLFCQGAKPTGCPLDLTLHGFLVKHIQQIAADDNRFVMNGLCFQPSEPS